MSSHNNRSNGFTLVEMIVVIPMVILILGVLIGLMLTLVNNAATSNGRTQLLYDTQDALDRIEQDAYSSTDFLTTYTPPSPQDINDAGTTAFTSGSSLIFNQYATTGNPTLASSGVVYYANQPYACSANYTANVALRTKIVYFIKNTTLYRRVIVPTNNQNATPDANTTCAAPWQRSSCTSLCVAKDVPLVTGVSSMTLSYYNKIAPGTPVAASAADTVSVTLSLSKMVGGNTITLSLSAASSRGNS